MKNLLLIVVIVSVTIASQSFAIMTSSYDFNGDYTDTLGNAPDLQPSGGTINSGRYVFSEFQGVELVGALSNTSDYAIEIGMRIDDSVSGYNKIIDYRDLSQDYGLYVHNGAVVFYNLSSSAGSVTVGNDFTVGIVRSGVSNTVSVFLNNNNILNFQDTNQAVAFNNILNFFHDDYADATGNEAFSGSADFIRIYSDSSSFGTPAVPVPGAALLVCMGVSIVGWMRRRNSL